MRDIDSKHNGRSGYKDVWSRNLAEIDSRIERFAERTGDRLQENMEKLEHEIRDWLDQQELDDKAKEEWRKLKVDSRLLRSKLQHRVSELVDRGRIKLKSWTAGGTSN